MAKPGIHGRFIWQELMTADPASATQFYSKLIGWKSEPAAANADYTVFSTAGAPVAGMLLLPETGSKAQWLPYIGADDVDATVARIEQLGGRSLRAMQDMEHVGRFAIVADPQGAPFAVFKPSYEGSPPIAAASRPGEFSWMELLTRDSAAAFEFYRELFGWEILEQMDMGPNGIYLIFGDHGVQRGGIYRTTHLDNGPHWLPYATVPDADVAAAVTCEAGGRVAYGPIQVPGGGRIVQLIDTTGVLFAVFAPAATPQKSAAAKRSASTAKSLPPAKRASAASKKVARATAAKSVKAKPRAALSKSKPAAKRVSVKAKAKRPAAQRPAAKRVASKRAVAKRSQTARKRAVKTAARRKK